MVLVQLLVGARPTERSIGTWVLHILVLILTEELCSINLFLVSLTKLQATSGQKLWIQSLHILTTRAWCMVGVSKIPIGLNLNWRLKMHRYFFPCYLLNGEMWSAPNNLAGPYAFSHLSIYLLIFLPGLDISIKVLSCLKYIGRMQCLQKVPLIQL